MALAEHNNFDACFLKDVNQILITAFRLVEKAGLRRGLISVAESLSRSHETLGSTPCDTKHWHVLMAVRRRPCRLCSFFPLLRELQDGTQAVELMKLSALPITNLTGGVFLMRLAEAVS